MGNVDGITPAATDAPDPTAPEWAIRPELPADLDQIHELHRTAFSSSAEAELVDAVRASAGFIPELSLVAATADGSILGHVLISRVELEHDAERTQRIPVLALAPIAVLPPHHGRGIGTALARGALAAADQRDEPFVVVLGSPRFFGPLGFAAAGDFDVTGPYDVAADLYQLRPRPGQAELPAGRVVYPPAFAGP